MICFFLIVKKFTFSGLSKGDCRPFVVNGKQVGLVRPDVYEQLIKYSEVFCIKEPHDGQPAVVELNPAYRDYTERSENVDRILKAFRESGIFVTLKGWRDEVIFFP